MLPDFLTGSPLGKHHPHEGGGKGGEGGSGKKKDKKHGMFHIGSPLKRSKDKESPKSDKKGSGGGDMGASSHQEQPDQVNGFLCRLQRHIVFD